MRTVLITTYPKIGSIYMYICICKQVSDSHVLEAWEAGHRDLDAVAEQTGLGSCCGSCRSYARDMLDEMSSAQPEIYSP